MPAGMIRFLFLLIALAIAISLAVLHSFNHFKAYEPVFSSTCTPVTGIIGPEDLQIDRTKRRVFISSYDRRKGGADRGAIHVVELDDLLASDGWRDRTGGFPEEFRPMGLSFYDDGEYKRLFVVNAANNSVELFDIETNGDLRHLETFSDARLNSLNDVTAAGPRSFYVTNDLAAGRSGLLGALQYIGRAATGSVFYFNGVAWRRAASDLRYANGVLLSPDGETLYVAETSGMALKSYRRDQRTGILSLEDTVSLPGGVDNLNFSPSGHLLIAANPKPLSISRHIRSNNAISPSQILEYDARANSLKINGTKPIFESSGEELSAATVADKIGTKIVVGALADDKFLICDAAR